MSSKELIELSKELEPDNDIFNDDSDVLDRCKRVLMSLPIEDKTIMLLYIHYGSLRKVAKQLGVSHTLIYKNINRIKKEFLKDDF